MAKIRPEQVVAAALELLDELGLDALTTRKLAQKLGVESATLYWHFRDKAVLLGQMASTVLIEHHTLAVPDSTEQWASWFADNARSFRAALLSHRDGARLHAGSTPGQTEIERLLPKIAYLEQVGFSQKEAAMALLSAGEYTLGCVLESQTRQAASSGQPAKKTGAEASPEPGTNGQGQAVAASLPALDPEASFEFGLMLMVEGLKQRLLTPKTGDKTPKTVSTTKKKT